VNYFNVDKMAILNNRHLHNKNIFIRRDKNEK